MRTATLPISFASQTETNIVGTPPRGETACLWSTTTFRRTPSVWASANPQVCWLLHFVRFVFFCFVSFCFVLFCFVLVWFVSFHFYCLCPVGFVPVGSLTCTNLIQSHHLRKKAGRPKVSYFGHHVLFCSILCYFILFYSTPFSTPFYSRDNTLIRFYSTLLYSTLFYSILFYSIPTHPLLTTM